LLHPNRSVGLDDATLWSRLLPPKDQRRLQALLPTPTVHELMSLPKSASRDDEIINGFLSWWSRLVNDPLQPLYPPSDTDFRKHREIAFLEFPGVERWASIVRETLTS